MNFPSQEQAIQLTLDELVRQHLKRVRCEVTPTIQSTMDFVHVCKDGLPMLSFCSNDYLGLAHHPELIQTASDAIRMLGVGAGSSPMVSGYFLETRLFEEHAARFVGAQKAIYFYAGYAANVGIIPALVGAADAIFIDKLSHACLIDGAMLSKARLYSFRNADMNILESHLKRSDHAKKLVISDAVFSMDGHVAPINELITLCERYGAWLLLDDAHGFGMLGLNGRGTLAEYGYGLHKAMPPFVIYMATLGKAAGVMGAFVAGSSLLIEYLLQKTRSYIFATAAPAFQLATLRKSFELIARADDQRNHIKQLIRLLQKNIASVAKTKGWILSPSVTPIQPLIVNDNQVSLQLIQHLSDYGIWAPAIRPPTVPQNTARIRIALSSSHHSAHIQKLTEALSTFATI